jgi:hypothetical protein
MISAEKRWMKFDTAEEMPRADEARDVSVSATR